MQLQFLVTVDADENTPPREVLDAFNTELNRSEMLSAPFTVTDIEIYTDIHDKLPSDPQSLAEVLAQATKITDEIYAQYDRQRTDRLVIDTHFLLTAVKAHIRQRMARYDHNSKTAEDTRLLRKLQSTPEGLKALADALKRSKE